MKKYKIKSGDTLSGIGKQYNIDWKQIAQANNINDPRSIRAGQTITIPTKESGPRALIDVALERNQYTIKSGDTLSEIAQKHGMDWQQLAAINKIDDPRTIRPGQVLNLDTPKLTKEFNQVDTSSTANVKAFQQYLKELGADITIDGIYGKQTDEARQTFSPKTELLKNTYRTQSPKQDNFQVIQDFYEDKPDAQYVVIDKKKNEMQVYKGNKLLQKYKVGLGSESGKDTITGITGKKGISGAGIYNMSDKLLWDNPSQEKYFKRLYGENILTLENESGLVQGMAIHQIPQGNYSRRVKLRDKNPNNDDFSWGCINCTKEDYENFMNYSKTGTKVYVLPEEEDNIFEVKNDRINFTTTNPEKDFSKYNYTYTATRNYLDPNIRESTFKKTDYEVPVDSKKAKSFAESLSKNKKDLMRKMGVDSDTYDRLAQIAVGTLGAESDFGRRKIKRNPKTSIYNEEVFMDIAEALGADQSHRSAGLTQLRYNQIPDWVKSDYGVTRDDLMDPEKSAIATMAMLSKNIGALRKNRGHIENMSRENELDFLPYMMNQPSSIRTGTRNGQPLDPQKNTYVSKVLDLANKTNVKRKYNFGGALSDLAPLLNMALPGVGTAASMVGLAATLAKAPTNYEPVRQNENPYGFKDGGMYQSGGVYPSGMDNQLSSDSYEVDYPGNKTDAKGYGPYQFDDNEVVDMLNQFVFSDEKDLGTEGLSPAEMVKPLKRAKGKAEKKLEKYPYDAEAKNTIMMSDMAALQVAQLQESKKPVNDTKYYKCGGKIKRMYAQGGPIEDIYKGILKLRPNAVNEYGENELRKMASTLYDSAYEANIPYQDYTAQLFQESGFSPDVVYGKRRSSAGAAGVTQLMPETAKRLNVNPADPYQAIPASAEEMSRIMNKNAKEGFGNDMSLAQQRYNAGGPSFRKFMKGSKQLSETEHYPKAIAKHKAKAFSAPQEEYTYQGYIDPELLSQYSVKALRNQVSPPRDNTAIAMRTNYQTGGPYDSPYAMDTTDLSQGNWALPPSTGILRSSTDLTPDYINLLKASGQPQPSGMAFLNTQISKGLPNRRMDMEEIMTPLERGLVNDASRTPQNILSNTEVYDRAKSPAMATPSDVQVQDINDLMTNGPQVAERKEPGFTFGDALQGVEVLGAFRGLGRGPEIDPLYQMQTRQIDDAPIRRAQASAFNAAASNVNTSSASGRNAVLSNLYANRLRGETDALTQLATQNKQLAGQTEQFNLGQRRLTDDINARNRAAFDQAQSAAFQTVGNTGRAFNKKKQGAQALKYLEATYPDVFKLLMSKIS